jgi:hypothetical protein
VGDLMISGGIDGTDQDFQTILIDDLGPKAVSAAIAQLAREAIAEAESINAAALGEPVTYQTTVDGRIGDDFDKVSPDGVIVATFDVKTEALSWIEQQLVAHSPVRTGHYQKSHRVLVDGAITSIGAIAVDVTRVVFAPLASYAPEIEPHDGKDGESRKAPDGVYQVVAALARQRFGNVADISFAWLSIPDAEQPAHGEAPAAEPAIVVDL